MPGWLTLIGSGETAPGMVRVHRSLLAGLGEPARPAFIDTPAAFELGLQAIHNRFRDYFQVRLGLPLQIASLAGDGEEPEQLAQAMAIVSAANYLVAGPGSPSYAVRRWRRSPLYTTLVERWLAGAQLILASSAAIAISHHTLPVYEIYKVGQDLHWIHGLDLLGRFGFELAIVTHWDNAEGGTHDTRACFMGMERFERLRSLLPPSAVVLGIDEHTACTLDLERGTARVMGRGGVSILRTDATLQHRAGQTFALDELRSPPEYPLPTPTVPAADLPDAQRTLAQASILMANGDLAAGLRLAAASASPDLAAVLLQGARALEQAANSPEHTKPLVDLLIEVRSELRSSGLWHLADLVRQRLAELGIAVRDTPNGTQWERTG